MEQKHDTHELKKYEELYSLAKSELEKAHSRFTSAEEKATRHFSLLVVLLAFVSIGLPELISIVKSDNSLWHTAFIMAYALMAIFVVLSVFFYTLAISYSRYKNIVLDKDMFDHFKSNKYVDVIFSLSKRFADDIRILNKETEKKLGRANTAFVFTRFSLIFILLTFISYVVIKLQ